MAVSEASGFSEPRVCGCPIGAVAAVPGETECRREGEEDEEGEDDSEHDHDCSRCDVLCGQVKRPRSMPRRTVAGLPLSIDFLPLSDYYEAMLERVAVLASDGVAPFELGVICEVFGTDRSEDGLPRYDFSICSHDGGPVRTSSGFLVTPHADLGPVE